MRLISCRHVVVVAAVARVRKEALQPLLPSAAVRVLFLWLLLPLLIVHETDQDRSYPCCQPYWSTLSSAILGKDRGDASRIPGACINEIEGDLILQALNGFLLILTCDGEVFYTSHTVETYLGFHQSDICHQSVYELVHSEDREELQRHLMWNSHLPSDRSNCSIGEGLAPENWSFLERNFTVRFRCLLDNTSGFLRLDIRGRVKVLHGQNHKSEDPPLALFAVCTPFGPPSLLEMPQKDSMFKSKHKLDFAIVSMDPRGKQLLGYTDQEFSSKSAYDLVHYDDLAYVASAHSELIKTGASGLIAYRLLIKGSNKWQWLQTSARLQYKNSKPEHIICTHRPLMEEEGRDLLGKRTMDFKVTYLDAGLTNLNSSLSGSSNSLSANNNNNNTNTATNNGNGTSERSNSGSTSSLMSDSDFVMRCQRNRKYKSQVKDNIGNSNSNNTNVSPLTNGSTGSTVTNSSTGSSTSRSSSSKRKAAINSSITDLIPDPSIYGNTNGSSNAGYESSIYHHPHHHHPHHHPAHNALNSSYHNSMYTPHHYGYNHVSPSESSYCAVAAASHLTTAAAATTAVASNFLSHLFPPPPPVPSVPSVPAAAATTSASSVTSSSSSSNHINHTSSSIKHHIQAEISPSYKDHHLNHRSGMSQSSSMDSLFPTASLKSDPMDHTTAAAAAAASRAASAAFLTAPEFLHSLQPYYNRTSYYNPDHHHAYHQAAAAAAAAHHHHHSLHHAAAAAAAHHHHPHAQYAAAANGLFESATY